MTINATFRSIYFLDVALSNKRLLHMESHHQSEVAKNILLMVNKCMSCISNNEEKFKKVVGPYQETLDRQTGRQATFIRNLIHALLWKLLI